MRSQEIYFPSNPLVIPVGSLESVLLDDFYCQDYDGGYCEVTINEWESNYDLNTSVTYTVVYEAQGWVTTYTATRIIVVEAQKEEVNATIPDANLKAALNEKLTEVQGKHREPDWNIWVSELNRLTGTLNFNNKNIYDLNGLENCTNIEILNLGNYGKENKSTIKNVEPLKSLANLKELSLYANNVKDITSLSNLVNLTYLNISNNQI